MEAFIILLLLIISGAVGLAIWLMKNPDVAQKVRRFTSNSIGFRAVLVFSLTILLLIPLMMIDSLVRERGNLYRSVTRDIAQQWAGEQTLRGPVLSIP